MQRILIIILGNSGFSAFHGTRIITNRHIVEVDRLAFHEVNGDFDRSRECVQPVIGLISVGNDRTAVNLISYFFHMREKVTHIEEVHHTFGVDDISRHQGCSERNIVKVGNDGSMFQFLLIEISNFQHGAESQIRKCLPIDITLDGIQIPILLNESRIRLSCEIVCLIIVSTGSEE